jgi:hypothetical protein
LAVYLKGTFGGVPQLEQTTDQLMAGERRRRIRESPG